MSEGLNKKFQELLDELKKEHDNKIVHKGEYIPDDEEAPSLDEILAPAGLSNSKAAAQNKTFVNEVIKANKTVISLPNPNVPPLDWMVQCVPDDAGVIHFQAKVSNLVPYYMKWYEKVTPELYEQVQIAYAGSNKRGSFYGSSKQYMICKRVSDTEVEVPGVGKFEVPELFGLERK